MASHLLVCWECRFAKDTRLAESSVFSAASRHLVKVVQAMTILGKFFTVLVFVMSIIFMAFSVMVFITHRNWREVATNPTASATKPLGLQQQLEQRKGEVKKLNERVLELQNVLAAEQAARRAALQALQTKLTKVEKELSAKEKELTELSATHLQAATALASNTSRMTKLTEEVTQTRDEIRQTQLDRDGQFLKVVALTDSINQANGLKGRLEERSKQLAGQVTQLTHIMKVHGVAFEYPPKDKPPVIDGRISRIAAGDLVEITIGHDDGIKQGHELVVYRGGKYVGRIRIRKTTPDSSVGQIIPESKQDQIREGDNVTTKFG